MTNYAAMIGLLMGFALSSGLAAQQGVVIDPQPRLTIGSVEGDGGDAFGAVTGAVVLKTGAVVVADRMGPDLRYFSPEGRLVTTAGRRGEGPGEFRTIMAMRQCAADTVMVYDPAFTRVSVFDPDGAFTRSVSMSQVAPGAPPPYDFYCGPTQVLAFVHRSPSQEMPPIGPRRPDVEITLTRADGRGHVPLGRFPASERYFSGENDFPRPLGRLTSVAVGREVVYLTTGAPTRGATPADSVLPVLAFGMDGRVRDTIRVPVTTERLDRGAVRTFIEEEVASRPERFRGNTRWLLEGIEYPEALPPHRALLADPLDNLWIESYPPPGTDRSTWRVFSRSGELRAVVPSPDGVRIVEVGSDYVVGVRRDDLGVQYVEVFDLQRGAARANP